VQAKVVSGKRKRGRQRITEKEYFNSGRCGGRVYYGKNAEHLSRRRRGRRDVMIPERGKKYNRKGKYIKQKKECAREREKEEDREKEGPSDRREEWEREAAQKPLGWVLGGGREKLP